MPEVTKKDVEKLEGLVQTILDTKKGNSEQIAKNTEMAADAMTQIKAFAAATARQSQKEEVNLDSKKEFESFAKTLGMHNRKALEFDQYLEAKAAQHKMLFKGHQALTSEEQKSLNTVIDPSGGFFMTPQWGSKDKAKAFDANGILDVVNRVNVSKGTYSDIIDWEDYDEAYYQNELEENETTQDSTDFKLFELTVNAQKYGRKFTREFLEDDADGVTGKVMSRLEKGMARKKALSMISGTSVKAPRGILSYADGTTYGTVEQITSTVASEITWDDVFDTVRSPLKEDYKQNGAYIMNDSTFAKLLISKDGEDRYQVGNQINFFSGDRFSISVLGNKVVFDANMPDVAANALAVAYGDFNEAYVLAERLGNSIIRDETHPDYVRMWLRNRHNGGIFNFEAFKILKIKA